MARLRDLLDSVRAHLPDLPTVVLISNETDPRDLAQLARAAGLAEPVQLVGPALGLRPHFHDLITAKTLLFLRWLACTPATDYALKLDTDALLIADPRPSVEAAMARAPEVAVWGAYRQNVEDGELRDFTVHRRALRRALSPVRIRRRKGRAGFVLEQALLGAPGRAHRYLRSVNSAARARGYETGEHVMGGAYAVTAQAARRMQARGWLEDPAATVTSRLTEDVVLGLLVRACGLALGSLVAPGEAFAVRHMGLMAPPETLIERGHAVVHSLKSRPGVDEDDLRARFRAAREATPASASASSTSAGLGARARLPG